MSSSKLINHSIIITTVFTLLLSTIPASAVYVENLKPTSSSNSQINSQPSSTIAKTITQSSNLKTPSSKINLKNNLKLPVKMNLLGNTKPLHTA